MLYPLKGLCKADTEGGPIVFTYVLFRVRKRILDFQFTGGFLPFWKPANVLSPQGTLQSRYRRRANCFYLCLIVLGNVYWTLNLPAEICPKEIMKMFDPPKGLCKADTEGGSIICTDISFYVRKRILDFQFTSGNSPFWNLENVLSPEGTL